jgi:Flp pilus assembly protein TadD
MKLITMMIAMAVICTHGWSPALAADINKKPTKQVKNAPDITCAELSAEEGTRLGLIRQMLVDGKPHAAIAHLDAAKIKHEHSELLRADALRQTDRQTQAQSIYEQLLPSCVSGYAYRGLGLIASHAGNTPQALGHLKAASHSLPTEHTIRNDHGYVLMQSGDYESALHEFLTALELAPDYRQAAHNLILLLYQKGDTARAETLANQFGVSKEQMEHLKLLAQENQVATP